MLSSGLGLAFTPKVTRSERESFAALRMRCLARTPSSNILRISECELRRNQARELDWVV
jgi:hypothetical protein